MRSHRLILALALLCAAPVGAQTAAKTMDADIERLSRAGEGRTVGPDTARVIILEFLDYQCPICATFHTQRADSLRRIIGGDVRIVYVNFPLAQHMRSFHGSEAAMCAGAVGGKLAYAGMADRLYRRQSEWSDAADPGPAFMRFAKEAAIDTIAFADCRARDVASPLLLADLETAGKFGIEGTPTFIVIPRGATSAEEGLRTSGNVSIADLTSMITKARAKAK